MSWHFSQALVAEFLEASSSDGELFAPWRSMNSAHNDSCNDKPKATYQHFQFGTMYVPLTDDRGKELLRWFLAVFHVKTSAQLATEPGSLESEAGYGKKWRALLARYDHNSCSWKTPQGSLIEDSEPCLAIWPRWGFMRDGESFQLAPLAHHTHEKECSFWPTPTAAMANHGFGHGRNLKGRYRQEVIDRCKAIGWSASAEMLEAVQGMPIGWTGPERLETHRFQQWLEQHGKF